MSDASNIHDLRSRKVMSPISTLSTVYQVVSANSYNISTSITFTKKLSLCPSFNTRRQVSHPQGTISKLSIWTFVSYCSMTKSKKYKWFWTKYQHSTNLICSLIFLNAIMILGIVLKHLKFASFSTELLDFFVLFLSKIKLTWHEHIHGWLSFTSKVASYFP